MTAEFFVFGHFDQKTKNEKWNEPDNYGKKISHRYLQVIPNEIHESFLQLNQTGMND